MTENFSYIDSSDIRLEISELESPDIRIDFVIPARIVKRIYKKLKKRGHNFDQNEMVGFLSNLCIDEGKKKVNKESLWGPAQPNDVEAPFFNVNEDFCFSIIVDLLPDLVLPEFSLIEIERPVKKVTEEMIDAELREQCLEAGTKKPHEGNLKYGDEIKCSYSLRIVDSNEILVENDDCIIRIPDSGAPAILNYMIIENLADKLIGSGVGDSISVDTIIPSSFHDKTKCGLPAICSIKILDALTITPSTVEDVIELYGSPNETVLRSQIKISLKTQIDRESTNAMLEQLFDKLEEEIQFDIPNRIVDQTYQALLNSSNNTGTDSNIEENEYRDKLLLYAKRYITRRALISILRIKLEIGIGEHDVVEQIQIVAASRNERPEDIRQEAVEKNLLPTYHNQTLERLIAERLFEVVKIKDITFEEYTKKTNNR